MIPFRVAEKPIKWQVSSMAVTDHSIVAAVSWVEKMISVPMFVREFSCLDALLEAGKDKTVSVYPRLPRVTKVASSLTAYTLVSSRC